MGGAQQQYQCSVHDSATICQHLLCHAVQNKLQTSALVSWHVVLHLAVVGCGVSAGFLHPDLAYRSVGSWEGARELFCNALQLLRLRLFFFSSPPASISQVMYTPNGFLAVSVPVVWFPGRVEICGRAGVSTLALGLASTHCLAVGWSINDRTAQVILMKHFSDESSAAVMHPGRDYP